MQENVPELRMSPVLCAGGTSVAECGDMLRKYRYAMFCIPSVWLLAACGAADPDADRVDTTVSEIVTPGSPPLAATSTTDLPGLPEGIPNSAGGSFVQGNKVAANAATVDSTWNTGIVGDKFSTPTALPTYLNNTEFLLGSGLNTYWSADQFRAALKDYLDVTPANPNPTPKSFGYPAGRARWLRRDTTAGSTAVTGIPRKFTELQQRGARLFCAAQSAFAALGNKTIFMGKRAVASAKILGKQIDFMAVEPSITMAAPQKVDTGTNDGAEAFIIPMAAGVRMTPLSLFKSLPELRAPVLLMTGDTDAVSRGNMDSTGKKFKEWETLTHFDAFASGNQTIGEKDTPPLTLMVLGPLAIKATFGATMEIASCAQGSNLSACKNTPNGPVKRVLGPTVFNGVTTTRSAPFPPSRSGGWTDPKAVPDEGIFNDDAWLTNVNTGAISDANTANPNWLLAASSFGSNTPMFVRASMDDDKSIDVRTRLGVSANLEGSVAATLGIVTLTAQLKGTLSVNGAVVHSFREEEEVRMHRVIEPNDDVHPVVPEPITALTDAPGLEASFTFGSTATLDVAIATIFPFHKSFPLWGKTLPSTDVSTGPWPEKERLRIVTAHDTSTSLTSDAQSHWPRGSNFASFPQSISACLAPTSPPPTQLPPVCTPSAPTAPPGGTTVAPVGSICFYYPVNYQMDADSAMTQCRATLSAYAKSAPTKQQTSPQGLAFAGQLVDTHAINFGATSADQKAFIDAINSCYNLSGKNAAAVENEINLAPCDLAGNLFVNAIEPVTPPAPDPQNLENTIAAPGACQAP
jgi:hypothetical protein